jgi:CII-binding regulator of phage lambda lysogenization HflD
MKKRYTVFNCRITTTHKDNFLKQKKEIDFLKEIASHLSKTSTKSDTNFFKFLKNHFRKIELEGKENETLINQVEQRITQLEAENKALHEHIKQVIARLEGRNLH